MWVIEGVEGGRMAILTKMHHSIIDGVSGMGLAEAILDLEPDPPPRPAEVRESLHDRRIPGSLELLAMGAVNTFTRTPYRLMRFGRQSLQQGLTMAGFYRRENSPIAPFRAPRTSLNGEFTPHRRFAWTSVSLPHVKALKDKHEVKLNDVVLALCSGALRRYLQKNDELPEQPLIAQCPVSLRTDADRDDVGNKVGSMMVSLATDIVDPALRLEAIHQSTTNAKEMQQALSVHKIMGLTETTPPGLIGLAARMYTGMGLGRMAPAVNVVVSNVPGPPFPLYMAGARLEAMYPMGPLLMGMGLNVTVISYLDSLDFGFMCCPEMIPQPDFIAEGVPLALEELEAAKR
jgi:WS/DGAT/MGAT family acyltransferase